MSKLIIIIGLNNKIAEIIYENYVNDRFILGMARKKPSYYKTDLPNVSFVKTTYNSSEIDQFELDLSKYSSVDIIYTASPFSDKLMHNYSLAEVQDVLKNGIEFPLLIVGRLVNQNLAANLNFIFVSSTIAIYGQIGSSLYSIVKKALESISESIAIEYSLTNKRSNILRIGYTGRGFGKLLSNEKKMNILKNTLNNSSISDDSIINGIRFLIENKDCNNSILTVDGGLKPLF